jgi:hypothetical protein
MRSHAILVAFAVLVSSAEAGLSQEESGRINGRVVTKGGIPASGVRIAAQGASIQGTRIEISDARGYFGLPGLSVGTYRLRVSFIGYRPVVVDSVTVRLGRATTLSDLVLEPQAFELGEIVVTAEPALLDMSSAATATNLAAEQFTNLPTDRNFRSIVSLAPQANLSFLPNDEVNIAGGTGPENAYFLDGVNITDPYRGSTSSNLPYNFVRELQVKVGGYEAEYGRATGGIINVITPSGGDRFGGQVFGFFTGNGLSASPRFVLESAEESRYSNYDFGGSLGGPIVRERLWFFAAYNPSFERQRVELPGTELPDKATDQHLFATKLSWRAGPATDVTVTLHGDPGTQRRILLDAVPFETLLNPEAIIQHDEERHGVLGTGASSGRGPQPAGGVGREVLAQHAARIAHRARADPANLLGCTGRHLLGRLGRVLPVSPGAPGIPSQPGDRSRAARGEARRGVRAEPLRGVRRRLR